MTQKISSARQIAFEAFIQVMEYKKKPEDELSRLYAEVGKDVKRVDKNLAKELLYGSLRWYSKIYWILQHTSTRKLSEVSPQIRAALILGTYQIFYLDKIPERAAVNESSEYVRSCGQGQAVSFVNGILRQIARRAEYFAKPDKKTKPVEYLSLQFAHPDWMVTRWAKRFKFEKLEGMLTSNNQPPPFFVRVNSLKTAVNEIQDLQHELLKEEHAHSERENLKICLSLKKFPETSEGSFFAKGFFSFQDQASQLIGYLVDPAPGEVIVDACAGPGGKITHLFELSSGKAEIHGVEKSPVAMEKIRQNISRLGFDSEDFNKIVLHEQDFEEFSLNKKIDKILLDAPCSGLGVLRRHPEAKWLKTPKVIDDRKHLQRRLIEKALRLLPVGGELIYSVCSFEPEESEEHYTWLQSFPDKIESVSAVSRLPDYFKRYVTRDNIFMVFSGNQDLMDGFSAFIVKLKSAW